MDYGTLGIWDTTKRVRTKEWLVAKGKGKNVWEVWDGHYDKRR